MSEKLRINKLLFVGNYIGNSIENVHFVHTSSQTIFKVHGQATRAIATVFVHLERFGKYLVQHIF